MNRYTLLCLLGISQIMPELYAQDLLQVDAPTNDVDQTDNSFPSQDGDDEIDNSAPDTADNDPVETYDDVDTKWHKSYTMIQDANTASYFFEMFIGIKLERVLLLIDTQANGTAIKYDSTKSGRAQKNNGVAASIDLVDGNSIEGTKITDYICLDTGEDTCLENFDFVMATKVDYPSVVDTDMKGVISFNQYGTKNDPSLRLVYDLFLEDQFFKKTLQLDFRHDQLTWDGIDISSIPSIITFNGIDESNMRKSTDKKDRGFTLNKNLIEDGKWLLVMEDIDILKTSVYTTFEGKKCNAVIATALKTIKMPAEDFKSLTQKIKTEIDDLITTDDKLSLPKACSKYNIGDLVLKIAGLYYHVPQLFYTQTVDDTCQLLLEINDEATESKDAIVTEDGLQDAKTNNGYILGQPFLRSFLIFLDFEINEIGFANKLKNYGAVITSERGGIQDNKEQDFDDDNKVEPDADKVIADTDPTRNDDVLPNGNTKPAKGMDSKNMIVLISFLSIIGCSLCLLICCCRKKSRGQEQLFDRNGRQQRNRGGRQMSDEEERLDSVQYDR